MTLIIKLSLHLRWLLRMTENSNAFDNTNNCPIYVPAESVSAYQSAPNWSTHASRIQAIPT